MVNMVLIGCGKMGGALLNGVLQKQLPWQITIVEPHLELVKPFLTSTSVAHLTELKAVSEVPDVIVLAVKPQIMDQVLTDLHGKAFHKSLVVSIAAGKNLSYFKTHLPAQAAIIRSMPNTPGSIGAGITVAVSDKALSASQQEIADHILGALGKLLWVSDESLMDAVTALSGSGPAYVFYLTEVLAKAGIALGLPAEMADELARETVIGSALLMKEAAAKTPAQLRIDVTSPQGTTDAALKVLMKDESLTNLFQKALTAAAVRSKELSDGR